jgi:hypothetical protein
MVGVQRANSSNENVRLGAPIPNVKVRATLPHRCIDNGDATVKTAQDLII